MSKDIKCTYCKAYLIKEYDFNNDFINKELKSKDKEDEEASNNKTLKG